MIHLVLDTTIFRNSPRLDSSEFKLLSYMAEKGCLVLHVPHVVEREQSSHLEQEQGRKLTDAIKNISRALTFEEHGPKSKALNNSLEEFKANLDELITERCAAFTGWLDKYNAVRHPITIEQSQRALDAYFNGHPPLKQPKVRKDIPDSFIFQQILDLKNTYQSQLGIVVEDGALRSACENAGIDCWVDLRKFITSPTAQKFLAQTVIEDNKAEIFNFVHSLANENVERILVALEKALLSDDYAVLSGVSNPGDNNEIYLSSVNKPYAVKIEDIEYLGGTVFMAYVRARAELLYHFPMFKFDALDLDEDKYHLSPLNDHYFYVETDDIFQFNARVELEFPAAIVASTTVDEVKSKLQHPTMNASDLEDFEIVSPPRN